MKRRDFLRTVGVTAAMSGLSAPAFATGAVTRTRYGLSAYRLAKYTARINKRLTPDMLTQFLGMSEGEAGRMIRRLTFENVLAAPDATGVSRVSPDYVAATDRKRQVLKRALKSVQEAAETPRDAPPDASDQMADEERHPTQSGADRSASQT